MLPARVVSVADGSAVVTQAGRRVRVTALLEPGLRVDDWVVVAAGLVVRRLSPDQAAAMSAALAPGRPSP